MREAEERSFFLVPRYESPCEGTIFSDLSENRLDFYLSRRVLKAFLLKVGRKLGGAQH